MLMEGKYNCIFSSRWSRYHLKVGVVIPQWTKPCPHLYHTRISLYDVVIFFKLKVFTNFSGLNVSEWAQGHLPGSLKQGNVSHLGVRQPCLEVGRAGVGSQQAGQERPAAWGQSSLSSEEGQAGEEYHNNLRKHRGASSGTTSPGSFCCE